MPFGGRLQFWRRWTQGRGERVIVVLVFMCRNESWGVASWGSAVAMANMRTKPTVRDGRLD